MTGWLLDTDALSAFGPGKPPISPSAAAWFREHTDLLFLSTITVAEIVGGIAKLQRTGATRRAGDLHRWFDRMLSLYRERVLPFDLAAAQIAGALSDAAVAKGRHPGLADVAIGAIAKSQQLVVLTLNLRHFEPLGVETLNPFELD